MRSSDWRYIEGYRVSILVLVFSREKLGFPMKLSKMGVFGSFKLILATQIY